MKTIDGIVTGPIQIDQDCDLSGIVNGTITVAAGTHVTLSGIVTGDVLLGDGASADAPGIHHGTIRHT